MRQDAPTGLGVFSGDRIYKQAAPSGAEEAKDRIVSQMVDRLGFIVGLKEDVFRRMPRKPSGGDDMGRGMDQKRPNTIINLL